MNKPMCEQEFEFVLLLTGIRELTRQVEDSLFEAGCDDATLSVRFGCVYLSFSRMAQTFKDAVLSAIRDVRKANIGACVSRIDECNLVTQAEIARRMGRSRQLVHQYMMGVRGPGNFPPPDCQIIDGKALWLWCEVADWLYRNDLLKEEDLQKALTIQTVNYVLDKQLRKYAHDKELTEEVLQAIGETPCRRTN